MRKTAVIVTLIALFATALFIAATTVVAAQETTTTTTGSGSTTTTTGGGSTTTSAGGSTTTSQSTTTTTDPVDWWVVSSVDVTASGLIPSFVSFGDNRVVWTGTIPGGYSNNYVFNIVTKTNSQIPTSIPGNYYNPSCDGAQVVYQGGRAGGYDDIYLYDLFSGTLQQITHNSDPGDSNDWNPRMDNGRIVWEKDMVGANAKPGIYVFDMNAGNLERVLAGDEYRNPDVWEDYVVAVKDVGATNGTEIVLLNLKTKVVTTIAESTKNNEHPRIDSGFVVWSQGDPPTPIYFPWDTYQIMLYDIASGKTYAMTDNKFGNFNPSIGGDTVVWDQTEPSNIVADGITGGMEYRSDPTDWQQWGRLPDVADDSHFAYFDDKKNILYYASFEPNGIGFIDVGDTDPYATAINTLANKQIVAGYEDGYFGVGDPVTRQQFSKMILLTMAQLNPVVYTPTLHDTCNFVDSSTIEQTEGELYAIHYVARASSTGLTLGYPDGTFRPLANISREQVITMLVRALRNQLQTPPADWQGVLSYADPEHGERIRTAEYNGVVSGIVGGTFAGLSGWDTRLPATRGEVAQMLYNLLRVLGLATP